MASFRDLPIKRKLTVIILGITSIALLVACAAFVGYELATFREAMGEKMKVLADVLGANSTAAFKFRNESDARDVLAVLRVEPDIIGAAFYDSDGKLFVPYSRDKTDRRFPRSPGKDGAQFYSDKM